MRRFVASSYGRKNCNSSNGHSGPSSLRLEKEGYTEVFTYSPIQPGDPKIGYDDALGTGSILASLDDFDGKRRVMS